MKNTRSGQTLIEVIIAIGLVVLVLTTLTSALVLGIRNNRFARDQALAKDYNRETLEWLRSLRDQMGWESYVATVRADGASVTYCLPTLPVGVNGFSGLSSGACATVIANTAFVRTAVLTVNAANTQIDVVASITWIDGGKNYSSYSNLTQRKWQ